MLFWIQRLIFFAIFISINILQSHELSPLELVVPQRADIPAKYLYAKHRSWEVQCLFAKQLYYRHLQVWNGFWELDPPKRSFEEYVDAFDSLLDSIKKNGFNPAYPIPLGGGGVICNGAHRLTSCLLYNKKVSVKPCNYTCDYGFDFFKALGLEQKFLDAMAQQYCELNPNCFILVLFPRAVGLEEVVEGVIREHAQIVCHKKLKITLAGSVELMLTMYDQEAWVGGVENNFSGARYKAQCCFPQISQGDQSVHVYLIESPHINFVKACKAKIRSLVSDHHSVHTTDDHHQAIVLARTFFNQNSIHCLNYREDHHFPLFENYLAAYQKELSGKESAWFCVDGGAVLAAYGLRECSDLDILHFERSLPSFNSPAVESHNCQLEFHALPLHDILFDPGNHFYYRGVKFSSLEVVKKMKEKRAEAKDKRDAFLINQVMSFEIERTSFEAILAE